MTQAEKQICMETGRRVRAFREQAHLTKEQLAEAVEISTQYVSDIEQGRKRMNFIILAAISRTLHVDMETLVFGCREDGAVNRVAALLRELDPVQRELVAITLQQTARLALELGPERREGRG